MAAGRQRVRESPYAVRARAMVTGYRMHATTAAAQREGDEPPCLAVGIRRCSVGMSTENHLVGGTTRRFDGERREEGAARRFTVQDPAVLRSEAACHAAVRGMLPQLAASYGHRAAEAQFWDQFVPPTLVTSILAGAARPDRAAAGFGDHGASGGAAHRSYTCDLSISVDVTTVYSEAEALLLSCGDSGAGVLCDREGGAGQCAICMDELLAEADGVMVLLGCSHAFHRGCIRKWFHKAATCPSCRRDMTQYLPHMSRLLHILM